MSLTTLYRPHQPKAMTKVTPSRARFGYDKPDMNRIQALRRVLFLKTLPDAPLMALCRAGCEKTLQNNEPLFEEGGKCLGLVVVLRGKVKIVKRDTRNREIVLGVETEGASLGDLALFDGGNYPACAEAVQNDTVVFIVPRAAFAEIARNFPQINEAAVRALAVASRKLMEMLKAQALHTVRARIAAYLLHAAGDLDTFILPETNAGIGLHVGTVREVVSRTLHTLHDTGAIDLQGRSVTILRRDLLHQSA